MRFLVDRMLGRLARWLRIVGYDAVYFNQPFSRTITMTSLAEHRIIITRNSRVSARRSYRLILIHSDHLSDQLHQLIDACGIQIRADRFFSRCSFCNMPVKTVDRHSIRNHVPAFVYATSSHFSQCPSCGRIFWQGTHNNLIKQQLSAMGISYEDTH
ncbi:MAG: hypothetical protein GF384_03975 [Elusimicrobia bacterium]|nr:hypothetical protein [Elusimicrobiota bacterium]MBD3412048.1 hypothetical protein [Elusimicrobiota bacterium]